jgi:hypothetical protein
MSRYAASRRRRRRIAMGDVVVSAGVEENRHMLRYALDGPPFRKYN